MYSTFGNVVATLFHIIWNFLHFGNIEILLICVFVNMSGTLPLKGIFPSFIWKSKEKSFMFAVINFVNRWPNQIFYFKFSNKKRVRKLKDSLNKHMIAQQLRCRDITNFPEYTFSMLLKKTYCFMNRKK